MQMRIVFIGAGGQLATDLAKVLAGHDLIKLAHSDLDICDALRVYDVLPRLRPHLVINTAAFHRVDDCEIEVEQAFAVNTRGVHNLAQACKRAGAVLLHFSTDYVFDGEKGEPYKEDDPACPINIYGISKLAGELIIRYTLDRYFIVRTSGLYGVAGSSGKGGNFVQTMLRQAREGRDICVVDDQRLTPTYTVDLASKVAWLIETESYGICHITNSGHCSWYEFAAKIFELARLRPRLRPGTSDAIGSRARRPRYSVLAHGTLQKLNADDLRPWPAALRAYLVEASVI